MAPERLRLARLLLDEYIEMYAARDVRLLDRFSEDFSGFAGSSDQLVKTREAWVGMVLSDFAQVPSRIGIDLVDVFAQDLSADVLAVTAFFHIRLPMPDPVFARETARLVLVFRQECADWKIAHSSISIPYGMHQGAGQVPAENPAQSHSALQAQLEERTQALVEARRQLEVLGHTDQLTGLANRRRFEHVLAREWQHAQRAGAPVALVLLDLDAFRPFNDDFGRLAGDACLQTLALVLSQTAERYDGCVAARQGSDEFALLLPGRDAQQALDVARHLREALAALALRQPGRPSGAVTASFGVVALVPGRDQAPEELVRRADLALRHARQGGGDRIERTPQE